MGILSALSGKVYRFNSLNTPIDNELNRAILKMDNSIEKVTLITAFYVSQKMVLGMFNPDNGMFNNKIKSLTDKKLRTIWKMLIIACVEQLTSSSGLESEYGKNLVHHASKILNTNSDEIADLIKLNDNPNNNFLIVIWKNICGAIDEDFSNNVNSTAFIYAFSDIYNTQVQDLMQKLNTQ